MQTLTPIRVTQNQACELLGISRDNLMKLRKTDSTFPTPIKHGTTRQAAIYFDYADLMQWHKDQKHAAEMQA